MARATRKGTFSPAHFPANFWVLYLLKGTSLEAKIFTISITFQALQNEICFRGNGKPLCFCGRNSME